VRSDGAVIALRCASLTIVAGRMQSVTRYTAETIDCVAGWDASAPESALQTTIASFASVGGDPGAW
jgi:hypothetical protein